MESLLARSAFNIFKLLYCVATAKGGFYSIYIIYPVKRAGFLSCFFYIYIYIFIFYTVSWIFTRQTLLFQSRAFVCRSKCRIFQRAENEGEKKRKTFCYFHKLYWNPNTGRHGFFFLIWDIGAQLLCYIYIVDLGTYKPTLLRPLYCVD